MTFNRFVELPKIKPLQEGEIPFGLVLVNYNGEWRMMREDQYMRLKANDPEYIREHKFAKQWLKETERKHDKEYPIRNCSQCIFCYYVQNKEGTITHWSCTQDNRLRTKDIRKRHEKCPIK